MKKNTILRLTFALYCLLMLWLLFFQRMGADLPGPYLDRLKENLNLVPLYTIRRYAHILQSSTDAALRRHAVKNLGGNVILFVPFGFFLPRIWTKLRRFGRCMLCIALGVVAVECIQLFTLLGHCDIDDLILNMLGAAIGYWIYRSGEKRRSALRHDTAP